MRKENKLIMWQKERTLRTCREIPVHVLACNTLQEKPQHEGQSPTAPLLAEAVLQPIQARADFAQPQWSDACRGTLLCKLK